MERKTQWLLFLIAVFAIFWIGAEFRLWQLKSHLSRLQYYKVTVLAVDARDDQPVPVQVRMPSADDSWFPNQLTATPISESKVKLEWIGLSPVRFGFSAKGYEKEFLTLGEKSPAEVTVSLSPRDSQAEIDALKIEPLPDSNN
jgi:hypothetical protein